MNFSEHQALPERLRPPAWGKPGTSLSCVCKEGRIKQRGLSRGDGHGSKRRKKWLLYRFKSGKLQASWNAKGFKKQKALDSCLLFGACFSLWQRSFWGGVTIQQGESRFLGTFFHMPKLFRGEPVLDQSHHWIWIHTFQTIQNATTGVAYVCARFLF